MSGREPTLRPRNLDREAGGLVETPNGPAFKINVGVSIPLRAMLADLPNDSISKLIREAEAELGRRGDKMR
jgi:hypothetical protein